MKHLLLVTALLLFTIGAPSTALAACTGQSISVGETKNGSLSTDDCVTTSGYYYDTYQFTGVSGQQLYILNSSSEFDVDLMLIYPDATTYLYDDDSGGGTNARIPGSGYLTLSAAGAYNIVASSPIKFKTGAYTLALTGSAPTSPTTTGTTVIEFYNANLKHYFITGDSQEAAGIDNGAAGPGWSRTGYEVNAWQTQSEAPATAKAVCRFYGTPGVGPNSHFYTADAGECALVKQDPGWFYEGIALYSQPVQYGSCPLGTTPVYRVYNNRWMYNDSNHRFVTDSIVYQQMIQQGWAPEGLVMCVNGSSYPALSGGTTATIGANGGTVADGSTSIIFPANAVTASTSVTVASGSATSDFPDATIVSGVKTIEIDGDIYQPITVQMSATGAATGKVFAVVASDTYTASSAVPFFRGVLYEATASGNILTATIPPSALANRSAKASQDGRYSLMAASGSTGQAKRRFTVWFITGYDLLQSSHFSISYPVKPCNSLVVRDYLQIAEDAYTKLITSIGFSPAGLAWPMSINVIKLDPGKYGEAGYGRIGRWISGTKSLSLSINQQYCNSSSQADMDEMKATIGHEFFHTIQYVYDPHWAVRESVFGSPFTWLMEASSTWFEAEMLNNSSYASPVFTGNADFYRNGLEHGGQVNAQDHGYGASGFLRYLTGKFGNGLILSTWANVSNQSGTYSSTGALASANVILSSEWQTFAEQYLTGTTSFGWATPGSSGTAFRYVYSDTKPTTEFIDDLYPLSGVKILMDFNSLKQDKKYTITLVEGKNSFIKAYLYKAKTKVAEFSDTYAFDATPGSGFYLIVVNSNDAAPYETSTHIKIKLESGPTITAISPAKGPVDTAVTIAGSGFGTSADTRAVYFNGLKASSVTWNSDTAAVANVPQNASTGDVVVEVNTVKSNGMNFEVLAQCSSTQNAGGDTPDTRTIDLGQPSGTFDFSYDTYWQEDQILVRYQGATLFDTGCVGATASKTLTYSGSSTQITVQVIPNCKGGSGTAWNYTVACPK